MRNVTPRIAREICIIQLFHDLSVLTTLQFLYRKIEINLAKSNFLN